MKPLKFVGSALEDLQGFAIAARRAAGFELWAVQRGLLPSDWKAMPTVGTGVCEIRIHVLGRVAGDLRSKVHEEHLRSACISGRSPRRHAPQTLLWRRGALSKSRVKDEERTGDQIQR